MSEREGVGASVPTPNCPRCGVRNTGRSDCWNCGQALPTSDVSELAELGEKLASIARHPSTRRTPVEPDDWSPPFIAVLQDIDTGEHMQALVQFKPMTARHLMAVRLMAENEGERPVDLPPMPLQMALKLMMSAIPPDIQAAVFEELFGDES